MNKSMSFEDLIVRQKAHQFVWPIFEMTKQFPSKEQYGLASQFRRASVSTAAFIVEGFKKKGVNDKLRFFNIAQWSIEECRCYLILSKDLSYVANVKEKRELLLEVIKLLNSSCKTILNSLKS